MRPSAKLAGLAGWLALVGDKNEDEGEGEAPTHRAIHVNAVEELPCDVVRFHLPTRGARAPSLTEQPQQDPQQSPASNRRAIPCTSFAALPFYIVIGSHWLPLLTGSRSSIG